MLTQEDFEECLQDITRMYDGTQEGHRQGRAGYNAVVTDREELIARLQVAEAKVAKLRQAIESVKAQADATPVGAEDEVKGQSVYNWLIYVYRLLKPALEESCDGMNNPARAHDWERLPAGGPWVARCRACGLQLVPGEEAKLKGDTE